MQLLFQVELEEAWPWLGPGHPVQTFVQGFKDNKDVGLE